MFDDPSSFDDADRGERASDLLRKERANGRRTGAGGRTPHLMPERSGAAALLIGDFAPLHAKKAAEKYENSANIS